MTLQEIKQNESIRALVHAGNKYLEAMGYTDHGPRHVGYVSDTASRVLRCLGYDDHQVELAAIAGWVHDVGNAINRHNHGANGAILLYPVLREMGMPIADVVAIITAVGKHEEHNGFISIPLSDIHDRVNFAIQENKVTIDNDNKVIRQSLTMDDTSSVMEYLTIYLERIQMCEAAADFLGVRFELNINGNQVNNHKDT